jgi:L-lactate dehydrogenase (cytochrome)
MASSYRTTGGENLISKQTISEIIETCFKRVCSAPAPMSVLYEMRQLRPDLLDKHQVLIDGGVTRGTDVLKALCLGARGVGLGRAFLYGNVWGEVGCRRVIDSEWINWNSCRSADAELTVMREEIVLGMQLLGVTRLEELTPERVRYQFHGARL